MSAAIVVKHFGAVELAITADAYLQKDAALEVSRQRTEVNSAESQNLAVIAVSKLKGLLKTLEESRKDVKAPVLKLGRDIDEKAEEFGREIISEHNRLHVIIQAYYRKEAEKAERARRISEDLARKKREAAEAEARKAQDEQRRLEEEARRASSAAEAERLRLLAAVKEHAAGEAQVKAETIQAKEVAPPLKAEKMTVRKTWKHEVTDISALYRARPELCVIEPRTYVINAEIRGGMHECPGLRIYLEIDATVRT